MQLWKKIKCHILSKYQLLLSISLYFYSLNVTLNILFTISPTANYRLLIYFWKKQSIRTLTFVKFVLITTKFNTLILNYNFELEYNAEYRKLSVFIIPFRTNNMALMSKFSLAKNRQGNGVKGYKWVLGANELV